MRENATEDPVLRALAALGGAGYGRPEELFERGLAFLVDHLRVDRAMVAVASGQGLESLWLAGTGEADPNQGFCSHVLQAQAGTLVIPDAAGDPRWMHHAGWRSLQVRAYLGAPLVHGGRVLGVLSAQCGAARAWQRSEIAALDLVAALFAGTMAVEALKVQLWQTQEALDLTAAVVEDNALETTGSGLPSRRYLEVWCRSNLRLARRRREPIALVTWVQPPGPDRARILDQVAGALREVDLLVDLGRDRVLLVLARTLQAGAEVVLARVRQGLGPMPMGATLWNPLLAPDRDDPTLQPGIRRAMAADPGGREAEDRVVWQLLRASRENFPEVPEEW